MIMQSDSATDFREFPILDDKYILIKKIGVGATCKVKLAKNKASNQIVAIKILKSSGGRSISINNKQHQTEIEMLKKVCHKNIISLKDGNKGVMKKPDGRNNIVDYIVLEYAGNGELFDYIYFPKEGLGEKMTRSVFKQLIEGLEGCHNAGVVHRDLKTENLMMNSDWILKIADFSYASLLNKSGMLTSVLGTLNYAAPEILNKNPYVGPCVDVFSCGVILFVLVTGKFPFGKALIGDPFYKNFIKNDYEAYWTVMGPKVGNISDDFKSFINLLLAYDPTQRPTITEIKNHSWMIQECPSHEEYVKEFERRKAIVNKLKQIEAAEESNRRGKLGIKTSAIYRSEGSSVESNLFEGERKVEEWIDFDCENLINPYKIKFEGKSAIDHLNFIANYFRFQDTKPKEVTPDEEHAKLKVAYENDSGVADTLLDLKVEKLAFTVSLKRVDDVNFVAEFTKLGGDKYDFFKVYDEFVNNSQNKIC